MIELSNKRLFPLILTLTGLFHSRKKYHWSGVH